jgi:hypothetical protein
MKLPEEFNEAILGRGSSQLLAEDVLIYDVDTVLHTLMDEGMSYEDAMEHFTYNIEGSYVGPGTPVWLWPVKVEDL